VTGAVEETELDDGGFEKGNCFWYDRWVPLNARGHGIVTARVL
jgi:hypothetical protein